MTGRINPLFSHVSSLFISLSFQRLTQSGMNGSNLEPKKSVASRGSCAGRLSTAISSIPLPSSLLVRRERRGRRREEGGGGRSTRRIKQEGGGAGGVRNENILGGKGKKKREGATQEVPFAHFLSVRVVQNKRSIYRGDIIDKLERPLMRSSATFSDMKSLLSLPLFSLSLSLSPSIFSLPLPLPHIHSYHRICQLWRAISESAWALLQRP